MIKKIINTVLISLAWMSAILLFFFSMALDSPGKAGDRALIIVFASIIYLAFFIIANSVDIDEEVAPVQQEIDEFEEDEEWQSKIG